MSKKYAEQDAMVKRLNRRLQSYGEKYGTASDYYSILAAKVQAVGQLQTKTNSSGILQLSRSNAVLGDEKLMNRINSILESTLTRQDFEREQIRNIRAGRTHTMTKAQAEVILRNEQQGRFGMNQKIHQALSYIYNWGYLDESAIDWVEKQRRGQTGKMSDKQVGELLNIYDDLQTTVERETFIRVLDESDYRRDPEIIKKYPKLKEKLDAEKEMKGNQYYKTIFGLE